MHLTLPGFRARLSFQVRTAAITLTSSLSPLEIDHAARREQMLDRLADTIESHCDLERLLGLARRQGRTPRSSHATTKYPGASSVIMKGPSQIRVHMPIAQASVAIPTPARYMARLCNHFAHRVTVHRTPESARVEFPGGVGTMGATADRLDIHLEANDAATLERLKEVVSRHLKQVASAETFEVHWSE